MGVRQEFWSRAHVFASIRDSEWLDNFLLRVGDLYAGNSSFILTVYATATDARISGPGQLFCSGRRRRYDLHWLPRTQGHFSDATERTREIESSRGVS